jgi:hypothetical protein
LLDLQSFMLCRGKGTALDLPCSCANIDGLDEDVTQSDWTGLEALITGPR